MAGNKDDFPAGVRVVDLPDKVHAVGGIPSQVIIEEIEITSTAADKLERLLTSRGQTDKLASALLCRIARSSSSDRSCNVKDRRRKE